MGLSMFTDVRSSWAPSAKAPRDVDAAWIEVPTYLAMRQLGPEPLKMKRKARGTQLGTSCGGAPWP